MSSKAKPGRGGNGLHASDFLFSRKAFWVTSREAPTVLWLENLAPSNSAVKAYIARQKEGVPDQHLLDHADNFDSFIARWEANTIVKEYLQVPVKVGEVGKAHPSLLETQDIFKSTQESDHFLAFLKTGEQVLPCPLGPPP